ncbi:MAG: hypothetical protein J2O49_02690 [Sciscionella sp.]|nr:hypothetical protein [Sciscionella sp.]
MDEHLFGVMAESVIRYLNEVDRAPSIRETHKLVAAWRALLRQHTSTGRQCDGCRRRAGKACAVWQIAIRFFLRGNVFPIDDDSGDDVG